MSDFQMLMKFPPNSIADVLRRLTGALRSDPTNAPYLTIYLAGGPRWSDLCSNSTRIIPPVAVTVGNFSNEDGGAEAVSYVPLAQIAAITLHAPRAFTPVLEKSVVVEDLQP